MTQCNEFDSVFTIAWEFPPRMSGESVVCFRTLKYSKFNYDVCSGVASGEINENAAKNIRIYPQKGKYIYWPFRVARLFKKMDRQNNYSVVLSRVMPPNGHLAGLLIKLLKPRIKWVVYFSDPIWNSPFICMSSLFHDDGSHRPNYLLMKLFGIPAKIAIHMGDTLVFNNKRLARYVLGNQYKKLSNKVVITPYGHDGVNVCPVRKYDQVFQLAHVGQIYGNRSFDTLIEALHLLKVQSHELYRRIVIRQVGFVCNSELDKLKISDVSERFELIDALGYEESIKYMKEADCLLIIDPCFYNKKQNLYVPAKIFDYMSTGKPFVAIADEDSATADITAVTGSLTVPHDAAAVCSMLENLIQNGAPPVNLEAYERFHCSCGTEVLDCAIEKLQNEMKQNRRRKC